jgi:hypothetical protein
MGTVVCHLLVVISLGDIKATAPYFVKGDVLKDGNSYYEMDFSATLRQNVLVDNPDEYRDYFISKKECKTL